MHFSVEEITRFQVRWEEDYDLPDQRYEEWVRMYHPEFGEESDVEADHGLFEFVCLCV